MTTVKDIINWVMIDWLSNSTPTTMTKKKRVALQMSILAYIMISEGEYYG